MTLVLQSGGSHFNESPDITMGSSTPGPSLRFSSGLILPPPDIKVVIDRTALFVARSSNPPHFEERVREGQRTDPKFSFLNPADPYHAYYRHRMDKVARGEVDEETIPKDKPGEQAETKEPMDYGVEPPAAEFILDLPNISPLDLFMIQQTALSTACSRRNFLASLSAHEGHNPQFEFLRPTHSLFGYFNQLVEQYRKIINPTDELLKRLKKAIENDARWKTLEVARQHAKWEKNKREREQRRYDDQEAERRAEAEIDFHEYAIVQTIEFTTADANSELPQPMSAQEVENMTLAQKRMTAMVMESTAEDVEAHRARQAAAEAEAAAIVGGVGVSNAPEEDAEMEQSDEEEMSAATKKKVEEDLQKAIATAQALKANAMNPAGPAKIRTDYVPKLGEKKKVIMTTCSVCGQQIAAHELEEHMRIELLDPKWKQQRDLMESRKAQASELQRGANVVTSLQNLARTRVDIFGTETDEERRKQEETIEKERRKEREKVVWDGHTATKVATMDKFSTNVNFDEQIAAIHRAKGLGPQDVNVIGPGIGPAAVPPPLTAAVASAPVPAPPVNSGAFSAATVASGPQPASAVPAQPPVMLPPLHYQGMGASQPFGYQPPPVQTLGAPPTRMAALAAANSALQAGMVRTAEQMEGEGSGELPPAKRQKVAKLLGGALYPEEDWIAMHPYPISLQVQMPNDPTKPDWKLQGQVVTIPDLPMNLLVSTLRDRILQHTGSTVPASKIRLSYLGKMLTNSTKIAASNLEDEDLLVFSVRDQKKK